MAFEVSSTLDSETFAKGSSYLVTVEPNSEDTGSSDRILLQSVSFPMALSRAISQQDPKCLCAVIGSSGNTLNLSIIKAQHPHDQLLKRAITDIENSVNLNYGIKFEKLDYKKDPVIARAAVEQYFERQLESLGWVFIHEFGRRILFRPLDLGGFSIVNPVLAVHVCIGDEIKTPAFSKFTKASSSEPVWLRETTIKFTGQKSYLKANLFASNPKTKKFEPTEVVAVPRMGHIAAHRIVTKRTGLQNYWRLAHGIFICDYGYGVECTLDGCEDSSTLLYPSECLYSGNLVERNFERISAHKDFYKSFKKVIKKILRFDLAK